MVTMAAALVAQMQELVPVKEPVETTGIMTPAQAESALCSLQPPAQPTGRRVNRRTRQRYENAAHDNALLNAAGFTTGHMDGRGKQYVLRGGQQYSVGKAMQIARNFAAQKGATL